jgi:hypothetical protein
LNRPLAGIGDVRAGCPLHNPGMDVFVVRASRPHVLILIRPREGELDIEYCKWLDCGPTDLISEAATAGVTLKLMINWTRDVSRRRD